MFTVDRDKGRYLITVNRVSVYGRLRKFLGYPPTTFRMISSMSMVPTPICGPPVVGVPHESVVPPVVGVPPSCRSPPSRRSPTAVCLWSPQSPEFPPNLWSPQLPETVVPCVRSIGEFVQPTTFYSQSPGSKGMLQQPLP